ncbi:triose-phosphate isomerase [Collinsella tanakaei]|uniref:triose-phosphate isomerase n=1 Tax=Collinsella tanakaei TaxID=626935 RepID=UPI0025A43FF6|nr:triose-phosphate isomerase [Collinsella tanakaei]MDM8300931.1 triose-phosphate isomerase [Collinsella tanakaei]
MPSSRTRLIAGNWKMNNDVPAAKELAEALVEKVPAGNGVEVVICPPTIDLACASHKIADSAIKLGAQNVYWEEKGAYTGETSCAMLKSVDAEYCIIGHSERRDYFHETDADENKKAKALIAAGITPIFCCGESLETREAGEHVAFVTAQIRAGLEGVAIESADQLVIAYEPIWAIGTGKTATAADAQEVCGAIRATLVEIFGEELAGGIRVLYGGSAKPENIAGFLAEEDVDGALVGGASLKADDFAAMVEKAGE